MSRRVFVGLGSLLIGAWLLALSGCTTGSHRGVSRGYYENRGYYGQNTWYDPHYQRRCCYGGTIVRPPHQQTWGRGRAVVRPSTFPHRSVNRTPSIPSKRKLKKHKRRKPGGHR